MANFRCITFPLTANFWKEFLYSVRTGSQPRNSTDLSLKTWCMNSTSELSRELQKSSKNFLLLGWKKRRENANTLKQIHAFWTKIVIELYTKFNEMISFYALPFKRGCDFQRIPYRIALKQI